MKNSNQTMAALLQSIADLSAQLGYTMPTTEKEQRTTDGLLHFSEKEIAKMPKTFRKELRLDGCTVHVRKRTDGRYKCSYEIRYRRNGYNLSVSATTIEDAKTRFIEKLKYAGKDTASSVPRTFLKFAKYWMENFHKRKVVPETYAYSQRIFKAYIATAFPDVEIRKITPLMAQKVLDALDQIARTKEGVYGLLNQIFRAAINHGILQVNPMMQVVYKTHDRTHGTALTVKEEKTLLAAFQGTPLQSIFALLLYTGLRPGELVTHSVKDRFIVAQNSKRKGGKIEYKKIPITPMLAPYVADLPENLPAYKTLCAKFKKVLPSHKFYDLRTTFQTRCTECGICDAAIGEFMGNSIGKLKDTYTDLSDDFLFNEGQKLKY